MSETATIVSQRQLVPQNLANYRQTMDEHRAYVNGQLAQYLSKSTQNSTFMKHLDVSYHFICELVEQCVILLEYINTKAKTTDALTKNLKVDLYE